MAVGFFDLLSVQGITFPSTNISSEAAAGFEVKDGRDTCYLTNTLANFLTNTYLSLALGIGTKSITAAQAKTLPGVTAGESVTAYCEIFTDDLTGSRASALEVEFFDESGTKQGTTTTISVSASDVWEPKKQRITVPANATRMNFYLRVTCGASETIKTWIANLKVTR